MSLTKPSNSSKKQTQVAIGFRLREARLAKGLTQSTLAKNVEISISYLNLIEHNKRQVSGVLLQKLARELEIDLGQLSGAQEARLLHEITNFSVKPVFQDNVLPLKTAENFVAQFPDWARAFVKLHGANEQTNQALDHISTRAINDPQLSNLNHQVLTSITSIRSMSEILSDTDDLTHEDQKRFIDLVVKESSRLSGAALSMFEGLTSVQVQRQHASEFDQVDDFLADHQNYFHQLENAADEARLELGVENADLTTALKSYLVKHEGFTIKQAGTDELSGDATKAGFHVNLDTRQIFVSMSIRSASLRFQLASVYAEHRYGTLISSLCRNAQRLTNDGGKRQGLKALRSYLAGAILYPYDTFLEAARTLRYDIDMLAQQFGGSFEQVCHRLVTLRGAGREGVPFAFMRTDLAGNISKRFNIPGLRLPRYGSACPLWAIYRSSLNPGRILAQAVELSEGDQYLLVASTVRKEAAAFGKPRTTFSVMLACDAAYANHLVYGDLVTGKDDKWLEVGVTCQRCSRDQCQHRAFPKMFELEQNAQTENK